MNKSLTPNILATRSSNETKPHLLVPSDPIYWCLNKPFHRHDDDDARHHTAIFPPLSRLSFNFHMEKQSQGSKPLYCCHTAAGEAPCVLSHAVGFRCRLFIWNPSLCWRMFRRSIYGSSFVLCPLPLKVTIIISTYLVCRGNSAIQNSEWALLFSFLKVPIDTIRYCI